MFAKKKITVAYTVERCTKCKAMSKRKFLAGDTLFISLSNCTSCDGSIMIEQIYGETVE